MIWEAELRRCFCVKGSAIDGVRERSGHRIYVDEEDRSGASLRVGERGVRGVKAGR